MRREILGANHLSFFKGCLTEKRIYDVNPYPGNPGEAMIITQDSGSIFNHLALWQWMEDIAYQAVSGNKDSPCLKCRHFTRSHLSSLLTCRAFPDGIPGEIIFGIIPHDRSFPGDHGIFFEPATQELPDLDQAL